MYCVIGYNFRHNFVPYASARKPLRKRVRRTHAKTDAENIMPPVHVLGGESIYTLRLSLLSLIAFTVNISIKMLVLVM